MVVFLIQEMTRVDLLEEDNLTLFEIPSILLIQNGSSTSLYIGDFTTIQQPSTQTTKSHIYKQHFRFIHGEEF